MPQDDVSPWESRTPLFSHTPEMEIQWCWSGEQGGQDIGPPHPSVAKGVTQVEKT